MTDINTQQQLAVQELQPIIQSASAYASTIEGLDIHDDDQLAMAGDLKKDLSHYRRKLEDKRTSLVGPLNKVVKDINELFKAPRDQIDGLLAKLGKKMNGYVARQEQIERERRAQEEREARERAERLREAEELARKTSAEEKPEDDVIVQTIAKQATAAEVQADKAPMQRTAPRRGDKATVSVIKTWVGEVVDVKAACLAIAEGRLPASLVTFSQADLNDMARSLEKETTRDGIKYRQDIKAGVR